MKKYIYAAASLSLVFAMGGPLLTSAHFTGSAQEGSDGGDSSVSAVVGGDGASAYASTSASSRSFGDGESRSYGENSGPERAQKALERARELRSEAQSKASDLRERALERRSENVKNGEGDSASSSERSLERAQNAAEKIRERVHERIDFELESTTTRAFSFAQLRKVMDKRRKELNKEEASTSPIDQGIVKNANTVRFAVGTLLAARPLLGGIGSQVSKIAEQVNKSVSTTTNAVAQIKSRGFWTNLLFGGDSTAARVIKNAVVQNQKHIEDLTGLLTKTKVSKDVESTLKEQIDAMEKQQKDLADLAQKEQSQWGLFSWRF